MVLLYYGHCDIASPDTRRLGLNLNSPPRDGCAFGLGERAEGQAEDR